MPLSERVDAMLQFPGSGPEGKATIGQFVRALPQYMSKGLSHREEIAERGQLPHGWSGRCGRRPRTEIGQAAGRAGHERLRRVSPGRFASMTIRVRVGLGRQHRKPGLGDPRDSVSS